MTNDDLTIVTAADTAHIEKLSACLPTWREVKGLKCPIICYLHGWKRRAFNRHPAFDALRKYDVKMIKWNWPAAETQRENMLSAFIFGVANDVKTPYHLKLDCVTVAMNDEPLPEYHEHAIIAPSWGYTKPGENVPLIDYWMNGLCELGRIPKPKLPENAAAAAVMEKVKEIDKRRKKIKKVNGKAPPERQALWDERERLMETVEPYWNWMDRQGQKHYKWYVRRNYVITGEWPRTKIGGARICSWVKIMRTDIARDIAGHLPLGRLPAPSEDTTCWRYCSNLGLPILPYRFGAHGWAHSKKVYRQLAEEAMKRVGQAK